MSVWFDGWSWLIFEKLVLIFIDFSGKKNEDKIWDKKFELELRYQTISKVLFLLWQLLFIKLLKNNNNNIKKQ